MESRDVQLLSLIFKRHGARRLVLLMLTASMVLPGKNCPEQAEIEEVAEATLRCLRAAVPAALPGIVFLSGGQSDEQATAHLNEMNKTHNLP